jgi:hypothetical protein
MDCPHCGEENLIGAKICASCGRNMMSLPAFRATASPTKTQLPPWEDATQTQVPTTRGEPPPDSAGGRDRPPDWADPERQVEPLSASGADAPTERGATLPVQVLCRVCLEQFDRKPEDTGAPICHRCRGFAPSGGGDAGENEVRLHPNSQDQPDVDPRLGSPVPRMKPVAKRASLRVGVVASIVGLVLVLGALGVVAVVTREKDPTSEFFVDVKAEDAPLNVLPSEENVTTLECTLQLALTHEMMRASFSSKLDEIVHLDQRSVQTSSVAFVRDDLHGKVVDVNSECRVAQQTGHVPGGDGADAEVYPWTGYRETKRLLVGGGSDSMLFGGGRPLVARDVPPCLTLGDIGAPAATLAPGAQWRHTIALPFLCSREGRLLPADFPCEITYVGKRIANGYPCFAFSVKTVGQPKPPETLDEMNRSRCTIRAAVLFEAKTGMLVEAHAFADVAAWSERGRIEDRVSVSGTMEIHRK